MDKQLHWEEAGEEKYMPIFHTFKSRNDIFTLRYLFIHTYTAVWKHYLQQLPLLMYCNYR